MKEYTEVLKCNTCGHAIAYGSGDLNCTEIICINCAKLTGVTVTEPDI